MPSASFQTFEAPSRITDDKNEDKPATTKAVDHCVEDEFEESAMHRSELEIVVEEIEEEALPHFRPDYPLRYKNPPFHPCLSPRHCHIRAALMHPIQIQSQVLHAELGFAAAAASPPVEVVQHPASHGGTASDAFTQASTQHHVRLHLRIHP